MRISTFPCRAWITGRAWPGTRAEESLPNSVTFLDARSRRRNLSSCWSRPLCACIPPPTQSSVICRPRSTGRCWELTSTGERRFGSYSGKDQSAHRFVPLRTCLDSDALPQHHQLSKVICIMVGHQQRLAQNRLPITPRDSGVEIDSAAGNEPLHRSQIFPERGHTRSPNLLIRRCVQRRPVSFGPFGRNMLRVAAELQDVPLREA